MEKQYIFKSLLKLDIQYFADGAEVDPPNDPPAEPSGQNDEETLTLTEKELQSKIDSETDRRVAKALETREAKIREKIMAELEEQQKQQKDLAALSEEERKIKEFELKTAEFEKEKKEFEFEQQVVGVKSVLQDKTLPTQLAKFLVVQGDNEGTLANINEVSELIENVVAERIKVALRQNTPSSGGSNKDNEGYKPMGLFAKDNAVSLQAKAKEKYNL